MKWFFHALCFLYLAVVPGICLGETLFLELKGHADKNSVEILEKKLEKVKEGDSLVLSVNSSSGEWDAVFGFAKKIHKRREARGIRVVVYIQENALGPTALVPFLADELYSGSFVSWGDIPLGFQGQVPVNLLRSQVSSLVFEGQPHSSLLHTLAAAMIDPQLPVEGSSDLERISSKGQTLVLNRIQLESLGLLKGVISQQELKEQFFPAEVQQAPQQAVETLPLTPSLHARLGKHISYDKEGPNRVGRIVIDDRKQGINQSTWLYVKTALDFYKETKPAFIILELNTPGGEVYAAQLISNALKEIDTQQGIPVVAYIDNWAISAGALLAYSTRFIAIVKGASMGAAEPVFLGQGGTMETAPEKINSALRAEFANAARFFDRDPLLAEAMVDKDIILVKRHGKLIKLNSEEEIQKGGYQPDLVISGKGKLLTLDAKMMEELGVADILVPAVVTTPLTKLEEKEGQWPAKKSPLFHTAFFDQIPDATIESYQMDWRTQFFVWLTTPFIASGLFLGMMLGFYMELNTPGFGLPGSVAFLCMILILMSSYALEIASYLEMIFLLVGLGLLLVEFFVLPGFGIIGIAGALFLVVGFFGAMLPGIEQIDFEFDTQTFNAAGEAFFQRLAWLCGTLIVGVILIALLGRFVMPTFAKFSRFVLQGDEQDKDKGFVAGSDPKTIPQPGTKAKVCATLHPAGKIIAQGTVYEAMSQGEFIEEGATVVVVRFEGSVIVVDREQ